MTRATNAALTFFVLFTIYTALLTGTIPTPEPIFSQIIPLLPWWALISFGAYSLGTLGYDVITFKDKEDKYKELVEQIAEAKTFLKKNSVDIE
ncbi:hypothetical protein DASC09_041410 [Saccharomycopsis crataegensis]|uniref:Dolichol-phosphate mannosyltransferase subunit 3 n=1 Tax=Saccharomycopsis crataegensis TaxID=43959 RepID=A0AAV5QQJ8_9ASCO|nr:hypothetical protein DASC09_041410 [Saccharomycopsis crataegensis]